MDKGTFGDGFQCSEGGWTAEEQGHYLIWPAG